MQFLVSAIDDRTGSATAEEIAAIDTFNERLVADGHWVFAAGLSAPGSATVIDNRTGDPVVTEGPFLPSPEFPSGFWILQAPDLGTALALATEASRHCRRKVEVRPLLGA